MWALAAIAAAILAVSWKLVEGIIRVMPARRFEPDEAAATQIGWHREVGMVADDGLELRAWFFPPPAGSNSIVYVVHGFTDSRSGMLDHIRLFVELGYGVLCPDSRGHGTSGGEIVTFGLKEAVDASRWMNWVDREGLQAAVFGQSMGAATALLSASRDGRYTGIIAESGFTSFFRVAAEKVAARAGLRDPRWGYLMWPIACIGLMYARVRYGASVWRVVPANVIGRVHAPLLLIHGAGDDSIHCSHSKRLQKASAGAKLWIVPGAGHTNSVTVASEEYVARVKGFLEAAFARRRERAVTSGAAESPSSTAEIRA